MSIFINGVDVSEALTTSLTSNTTLTRAHRTILCDSSGGTFTVTLPAAANSKYQIYEIKKTDTSGVAVLIDGNAAETIDGDATKSLNLQYESLTIQSDGSNWHII